jgi:hypothetical protein
MDILSANLKTGYSINTPILETCDPTSVCREACYARKGRLAMPNSLNRQALVFEILQRQNPEYLGKVIINSYRKKNLSFLRWCGSGDLTKEVCEVINQTCLHGPETVQFVVTRKTDMLPLLMNFPNLFIGFSLDGSCESVARKKIVDSIQHPRQYYSYLRQRADEDTHNAAVIFNLQRLKHQLPKGSNCCPVDTGQMKTEGACEKCKRCFSKRILNGTRK